MLAFETERHFGFSGRLTLLCHELCDAEGLKELEISRLRMLRDATPATFIAETFSMLLLPFFQSCLMPLDSCVAPLSGHLAD